ncbi:MAG: hypothetical protein QXP47_03840, partial [Candidatus Nezhaarchaeales archaeon]
MRDINIDGYVIPKNLLYSENHVWAKARGDVLVLGVTDFLQKMLGTIISVNFPGNDSPIRRGNPLVW